MKYLVLSCLFFGIFSIVSCGNEIEDPGEIELGLDFAPLELGKFRVYRSDSIVYRQGGLIKDSLSGFIKEEVVDTFRDAQDILNYRLERSFKRTLSDPWEISDIWSASKSMTNYIRNEENLKFVSLIFPIKKGVSWDGNIFFDENVVVNEDGEMLQPYKNWEYNYAVIDSTFSNGNITASDVVLVQHINEEIIIEKRVSSELYAKGIGLVHKNMIILDCQQCTGVPGEFEEDAEKGYILTLDLIEHN